MRLSIAHERLCSSDCQLDDFQKVELIRSKFVNIYCDMFDVEIEEVEIKEGSRLFKMLNGED